MSCAAVVGVWDGMEMGELCAALGAFIAGCAEEVVAARRAAWVAGRVAATLAEVVDEVESREQ